MSKKLAVSVLHFAFQAQRKQMTMYHVTELNVSLPQVYYISLPLPVVNGNNCKSFSCGFCFLGRLKQNRRFQPLYECTAANCLIPQHHTSINHDEDSNTNKQTASKNPRRSKSRTIYNYLQPRNYIYNF